MGFKDAVRICIKQKYATFQGRAARSEYWWFYLFYLLVLVVLGGLGFAFSAGRMNAGQDPSAITWLFWGLAVIFMLGMILPMIAVTVRRFHDVNLSAWWYLGSILVGLIPVVGWLGSVAVTIWKRTRGDTKFGPGPLRPATSTDIFT